MTTNGLLQWGLYMLAVGACVAPLGRYMARVYRSERTFLDPILLPVESVVYRLAGVKIEPQHWTAYAGSFLAFHLVGFILLYSLLRLQTFLPWSPPGATGFEPTLAWNTAISFVSNTNWQAYAGESASHTVQMLGLTVQNFVSAAAGMSVAVAFVRGFAQAGARTIGNFWFDLTRSILWILLPLSIVLALALVWCGVPQTLATRAEVTTLEGRAQTIALGPIASQEAIKQLGTNGGGFFNANSAHPYENPTPFSNFLAMIAIFAIGAALTNTAGLLTGRARDTRALLIVMAILLVAGGLVLYAVESQPHPAMARLGVDAAPSEFQAGGNMEGKETRFGIAATTIFANATTSASCGAVNGMHASFLPLGGLVVILNILLGEIIVGGVGAGLYGMLLFAIIAVFIAGLMVGRTPEYLGKKVEAREVKLAMLSLLVTPLAILGFASLACVLPDGLRAPMTAGPHGFTEILYAFASGAGNNGSAFASLSANTAFYNLLIGIAMLLGRFMMIVPILAIAGSLAAKKTVPASVGTFPTNGGLFIGLLVGTILIVGGLTFFPALALGPIAEHVALYAGRTF